jgi:hypothetical protein
MSILSQQLGHAIGLAAIGTVIGIAVSSAPANDKGALLGGLRWAVLIAGSGAILALITTLKWLPRRIADYRRSA